ncbi:MAG: acyl-CoA dehydrogenase family protein [Proteobacteria bacterium]|nr:acyl-CoA dehydrogenase family protein [Pseudomonadota bacterium]
MNFEFTEEQKTMIAVGKDFAEKEIRPTQEEDEKEHRFRKDIVKKMAELGFFGCVIPEKYGGNETGHMCAALLCEEIGRVSASMTLPFNCQAWGPALAILNFGTEEQKEKYIPPLVNADMLGAFAITEPNSGSDVAGMGMTATETDDGFVLNGTKMWISNIQVADLSLVYAYTDKSKKHKGISCFVVDNLKTTPGITTVPIETKLGLFCAPTGEISFEDVKIPKSALLGERGQGFKICMTQLDQTRLGCAARGVGITRACHEESIKYALERTQFGVPIFSFQMIQEQIAEMYVEYEAARLLVLKAAFEKDQGNLSNTLSTSTAKYNAAETAVRASNAAMKVLGSYSYSSEYPVERYFRDAKSLQAVEGTSNIQKVIIARNVIK